MTVLIVSVIFPTFHVDIYIFEVGPYPTIILINNDGVDVMTKHLSEHLLCTLVQTALDIPLNRQLFPDKKNCFVDRFVLFAKHYYSRPKRHICYIS